MGCGTEAAARRQLRPIERVGTEAEERARMKPGSIRSILYQMLTEAGEEGMSAKQLIRVSTERKLRDWGDTKPKSLVMSVRLSPQTLAPSDSPALHQHLSPTDLFHATQST
jgi:hypothetical protein